MENYLLVGCGILKKEIRYLIDKNQWPIDTSFLDSSLHVDFNKLSTSLTKSLDVHKDRDTMVFYGSCHPRMEQMLYDANAIRTIGQNCIDILLGSELFTKELTQGAFFLLEDWALRWEKLVKLAMGPNLQLTREIFRTDRKYILGLNTPCSGDFTKSAQECSDFFGVPLYWMDATLEHLESVLEQVIMQKQIKK